MRFVPALHDDVRVTLGHAVGPTSLKWEVQGVGQALVGTTPYETWSSSVERPQNGVAEAAVPCPTCGAILKLKIKSKTLERTQRIWMMIGGIWFAVFIVGIALIVGAWEAEERKIEFLGPSGHALIFPKRG